MSPEEQKKLLIEYMLYKIEIQDWHAVADVACDIRELESANQQLKDKRKPG